VRTSACTRPPSRCVQRGTQGSPAAGRGAAGGGDDGSAYQAWKEKAEGWVREALEGAAKLGGVSRMLAAALARAGALGAADRLAQRFADAHREGSGSKAGEMFVWECMEDVLRAVGRHLPEVRAPRAALQHPCLMLGCGRR